MDALHYLGLVVSILFIVYQFTANRRKHHKNMLPSPPRVSIIDHFLLLRMPIGQALNNFSKKYGPIFLLRLGSRATLVLSSRSAIQECFPKNDIIFCNRPLLPSHKISEYNYILGSLYGNHWRNLRRFLLVKILSTKSLQMSSEIRIEEIKFMIKHLYKSSFKEVKKVDVKTFLYTLSFNTVMKMVAGKRCFEEEELDSEKSKGKLDDLEELFSPLIATALGDYFPFLRWLTYYGLERKRLKTHKRKDAFIQSLLDARQNHSSLTVDGQKTNSPIIDVMLKLQESEPEFYSNDVIKGIVQVLLLAGTHTTANTMEWVISQLLSHPDAFQKARDEIENHVGNSRLINDTDLAKLPYLYCIINEILRLNPGEVLPPRESSEDCTVGGYLVPRGTQLFLNASSVHRDPELWTEPDEFKPERFLENQEEKGKFKFIAFGIGRRVCPGEGFALRIMALSLGTLIQCFDWEDARDESHGPLEAKLKANMKTNLKKRSVQIRFRPREALSKVLAQL